MTIGQLSLEDVVAAGLDAMGVHTIRLSYIYGPHAVERMVGLPEGGLEQFREARAKAFKEPSGPRPLYDEGYNHWVAGFEYAWQGRLPRHLHPCDMVVDLATAAAFFRLPLEIETFDSEDFSYAQFKGLSSAEVLTAVADAAYGRWAISEGYPVSIDQLAALARVSEKTLRMAANPRFPGALQTSKVGTRTVIEYGAAEAWLTRRPDFIRTEEAGAGAEDLRGDTSALARFLAGERTKLGPAAFKRALAGSKFPATTWSTLEQDRFEPALPGLDAASLLSLGKSLAMQSPSEFAAWVLQLVKNARHTHAELLHRAEMALINQSIVGQETAK